MKLMWPRAFVWYSIYHKWCNIFLHIVLYMNLGLLWIYIHYIFESKSGTNLRDFLAYSWLLWRTTGPQFNQTHLMMKKRKNSITNFLYERRDVRFCMFCLDNCNIIVVLIGFYWNMSVFFYYWHSFLSTGVFSWMKLPVPPTTFSHSTGKQLFISPVASIQWLHHRRVPEKQTAQYELFVHLINCTRGKFYWLIITYYNINMVG